MSVRAWSRDGRLAVMVRVPPTNTVMTLRLDDGGPPKATGAPVRVAEGLPGDFSPDGAWLAYCDCGTVGDRPANVFVKNLQSGTTHRVSIDGGNEPRWAPSGRELFFRDGQKMMVASLAFDGAAVRIGRPQMLFEGDYLAWGSGDYDVTADGKQFVMVRSASANTRALSVHLNWKRELERLAPIEP